jgi:DNA-binding transcriptional ArsR family regulator
MARPRNPSRHRAGLLPPDFLVAAAARFRALSVAARLRILDALMAGPETIGGLVRATGLEQSNLSRHVAALERAGCVRREPRGRTVVVSVSDPTLRRLCEVVCRPLHSATARAMER